MLGRGEIGRHVTDGEDEVVREFLLHDTFSLRACESKIIVHDVILFQLIRRELHDPRYPRPRGDDDDFIPFQTSYVQEVYDGTVRSTVCEDERVVYVEHDRIHTALDHAIRNVVDPRDLKLFHHNVIKDLNFCTSKVE